MLTAALLGAAGGIATLDAGGKIPAAMIPAAGAGSVSSATLGQAGGVATLDGSAKLLAAQIPASVITTAQVGAASGVASLDATGKVPAAQLSAVGFTLNLVTTATLPAVAGNLYVVTVQNTLTMGSTPTVGDQIQYSNQSGLTTCVVARGGSKINGLAEDMTVDGLYASFILRYVSPAIGWITL